MANALGLARDTGPRSSSTSIKVLFLFIALLPPLFVLVVLWIAPIGNEIDANRIAIAARDYTDMWTAGHLVALGRGAALSNTTELNAALKSLFGAGFPLQVWPYPPPILLLATPLSALPLLPGFLLYTAGTLGLLWWALRVVGLTAGACGAVLLSPAVADNALSGQNGALTEALLLAGLVMTHRRPAFAGALLGILIIKPQMFILVPLCLVASRNWRALLALAASASFLVALSGALFGIDLWTDFLTRTRPAIAAIMETPWQALPFQRISASWMMAARSLGASTTISCCIQVAISLICAVAAWRAWRIPKADPTVRALLTGLLTVAAAPWIHTYDMIPLAVAVVVLVATPPQGPLIFLLAFAWIWPGASVIVPIPPTMSAASVPAIAWFVFRQVRPLKY